MDWGRGHRARLLSLLVVTCCVALAASSVHLIEDFEGDWESTWVHSTNSKYTGRFTTAKPDSWTNRGLQMPEKNHHYGIVSLLPNPVQLSNNDFIVQYEVRHTKGHVCGGSYLKLLSYQPGFTSGQLHDQTPYSIMFGPDKCGSSSKVHLILRHTNPLNGTVEERHLASPPVPAADTLTHVYTLKISPPTQYQVLVDGEVKASGDLLEETAFQPPFQPPKEIDDPDDKKPSDWVDDEMMPDPEASRPADWDDRQTIPDAKAKKPAKWLEDESPTIPDPAARKPAEWDEEEDGEWLPPEIPNPKCKVGCGPWSPPLVPNPDYKGPWKAPLIPNPDYKGPWAARRIPNPHYWQDHEPLKAVAPIGAVAIEVWTIDGGYVFDNLVLASSDELPAQLRHAWQERHEAEVSDQKAAAEKQAQKQKKDKDTKAPKPTGLAKVMLDAFRRPPLKTIRPYVKPLLRQIRQHPPLAWVVLITPLAGLMLLFVMPALTGRSRKAARSSGYAKKHDIPEPDDDDVKDEADNDDVQAAIHDDADGLMEDKAEEAPAGDKQQSVDSREAEVAKVKAAAQSETAIESKGEIEGQE